MTDTIEEARALVIQLDCAIPLGVTMSDVAHTLRALVADLERTRADLAAAREAMPTDEERFAVERVYDRHASHGVVQFLADEFHVAAWLRRFDAYRAAHPAESEVPHAAASRRALDALAQMGPEEARQTFVAAGIVDDSGRLTDAYAAAPDLPEPCAVCRNFRMRSDGRAFHCDRGWISVPDLSGAGVKRFVCHECLGTGRADGGVPRG